MQSEEKIHMQAKFFSAIKTSTILVPRLGKKSRSRERDDEGGTEHPQPNAMQ